MVMSMEETFYLQLIVMFLFSLGMDDLRIWFLETRLVKINIVLRGRMIVVGIKFLNFKKP